jgi:hypothetical protein
LNHDGHSEHDGLLDEATSLNKARRRVLRVRRGSLLLG